MNQAQRVYCLSDIFRYHISFLFPDRYCQPGLSSRVVKLNPLQLVLVGTVLEFVAFVCQMPTGVLADIYSRRLAVTLGIFLFGMAFVIERSFPRFDVILAS